MNYKTDFILDISGSTNDHEILMYQKLLYSECVSSMMKSSSNHTITFSDSAHVRTSLLDVTYGTGGTYPCTVVPHLRSDADTIIFFTDGQIGESEMIRFANRWKEINYIHYPKVVIVLSLGTLPPTTLDDIELKRHINFSIPQVICSLFDHVLILFSIKDELFKYDAKGIFSYDQKEDNNPFIHNLPKVTWTDLVETLQTPTEITDELVLSQTISISVEDLYNEQVELSDEIWQALSHRSVLAKIDCKLLKAKLAKLLFPRATINTNQMISLSIKPNKTPEEEEILINWRNAVKLEKKNRRPMLECLSAITKYQSMGLSLGSNRARGAEMITEPTPEEIDAHSIRGECPIMMEEDTMGLLLKAPTSDELIRFTSDECMEQPFMFGTLLKSLVTPGFFGSLASTQMTNQGQNPFTREPVAHFLPLVSHPETVMRICSTLWGSSKVQWHMVRGYISMLCHIVQDCEWATDWKSKIKNLIIALGSQYQVTKDLKGGSDRIPFGDALIYVFDNVLECLRTRTKEDVEALMVVYETIHDKLPEKTRQCTLNIMDLMDSIRNLRLEFNLTEYVMEVDELNHFVKAKTGIKSIVARFLWTRPKHSISSTIILDKLLNDSEYGPIIKSYIMDGSFLLFERPIALEEPEGIHFGKEIYPEKWETHCVYCGVHLPNGEEKQRHLREQLGKHFYRGYKAAKIAVKKLGPNTPMYFLFQETKNQLYKWYGNDAPFLHTKRCRKRLLELIEKAAIL